MSNNFIEAWSCTPNNCKYSRYEQCRSNPTPGPSRNAYRAP